jgi:hypothetical protein
MKPIRTLLLDGLSQKTSPAFRQIQQMAADRVTNVDFSAPAQTANEVLSVWSIRLWNATLRGRRFVGLADFVRVLMGLAPGEKIEQVSFRNGQKTGLVFFSSKTKQPLGAVVSVRTDMDERRSRQNFARANGVYFPAISSTAYTR